MQHPLSHYLTPQQNSKYCSIFPTEAEQLRYWERVRTYSTLPEQESAQEMARILDGHCVYFRNMDLLMLGTNYEDIAAETEDDRIY